MRTQKTENRVGFRSYGFNGSAHGEFRDPEDADILVTLPAEAFVRIYSGEVGVSAVTSLVLRGKVGVVVCETELTSRFAIST